MMERWIHIDLKGAPPGMPDQSGFWTSWCNYVVAKGRVSGLVIEFEDVLPIPILDQLAANVSPSKRRHIYSREQAATLIGIAKSKGPNGVSNYKSDRVPSIL